MLGLKTQESSKFIRFFKLVQVAANIKDSVFFLDSGDGRDIITDTLEGEDLSGWLVPKEKAKEFELLWKSEGEETALNEYYCIAVWKLEQESERITITFE